MKPLLKWAGGKRWLAPRIAELYEPFNGHSMFVEPFCGAAAVALHISPDAALINDSNPHVQNFHRCVKNDPAQVQHWVNIIKENDYYHTRKSFNHLIEKDACYTANAAAMFYVLNRSCYNGLCRFNNSGLFNTPQGKYKKVNYNGDFGAAAKAMSGWGIWCMDFMKLPLWKGDFIYADPPYDDGFSQYGKDGFSWERQVELAEWLSAHDGPVVATNKATDRVLDLYGGLGFEIDFHDGPRRISSSGDRTPVREMLARKGC